MAGKRGAKPGSDLADEWRQEHNLILIEGWARDGLYEKEIAHNIGISPGTLILWKKTYPEIANAIKKNKEVADRIVENSLFKKANGFEYTETTEERVFNPLKNQFEMVVTKRVNKFVLPDTTAQIFWLKNKKPDVWQDRRQIESTEAIDKLDSILSNLKTTAEEKAKKPPESPFEASDEKSEEE